MNIVKKGGVCAALAIAVAPAVAHAGVTELVTMHFQSGGTFTGDVTFADDFSSYYAVTGTLSGGPYGNDPITWVWDSNNWSSGPDNYSNWLMDGTPGGYSYFIQFAYNYSGAPHLSFTSGVSFGGFDNYVNYSDPMVSGTISVPEPSTWGMLLIGFGGLAFARYGSTRRSGSIAV